ncbi:serum paraoxonase/arylesterase 2 [Plakobranchus ocellatus]|uniref:Serum paraoxonase/arylesterase 2 n=1 Tax=Plakobranchus ocellatus TaxID=259542 RepID=A0AAV4B143_9GAST|nr:serum paraoxonase/arylesterase 2 [Plakobranchus ocellatus]
MFRTAIGIAVLSLVAYVILSTLKCMDVFKTFHKHYPGTCSRVKNAGYGSEDIAWTSDGLAFVTSGPAVPALEEHFRPTNTKFSEIQLFDFKNPSAGLSNLKIKASKGWDLNTLRPHGLGVLEDKVKGEHMLYVVNHPYGQTIETVEKFRFDPKARNLVHLKSIVLDKVSFGNDVAPVAEDQFYITNWIRYKGHFVLMAAQDLLPLHVGGLFFFNGTDTVEVKSGMQTPNGICLRWDLNTMRPHGLGVLEDKVKGEHMLYVVNHPYGQTIETVEKFRFDPKARSLVHLKSIVLDKVSFGNDVAPVAEDQFYITNWIRYKGHFVLMAAQDFLPLHVGGLFFFNGTDTVEVKSGMQTPNGICLSKDKKFVYVTTSSEEKLNVFKRDSATNNLQLVQRIPLQSKVDNPNLTPSADALLIGAHPISYRTLLHLFSPFAPEFNSPSSVLRIPLTKDGLVQEKEITELFYDHGDLISGSSSAVVFDKQLLVGSVAHSMVRCELQQDV